MAGIAGERLSNEDYFRSSACSGKGWAVAMSTG